MRVRSYSASFNHFFTEKISGKFRNHRKSSVFGGVQYIPGPNKGILFPSPDCWLRRHPVRVAESFARSCDSVGSCPAILLESIPLEMPKKQFPASESLVSDIPAGDGKSLTYCYSVLYCTSGLVVRPLFIQCVEIKTATVEAVSKYLKCIGKEQNKGVMLLYIL